jgi:hypothetical protein
MRRIGQGGMRLTDDKDEHTYALVADKVSLQPGRRVTLKGKKSKGKSGTLQFGVRKLVKDQGTQRVIAAGLRDTQNRSYRITAELFSLVAIRHLAVSRLL